MPNTRISDLTAATSVAGTDVYPSVQTAGVGPVKTSLTQITAFALANAPAGAVATPSIAPTGDTNTGFWFPAADTIAASTGGSERLRINSSGNVGIGTTSPVSPLSVNGIISLRKSDAAVGNIVGDRSVTVTGGGAAVQILTGTSQLGSIGMVSGGVVGVNAFCDIICWVYSGPITVLQSTNIVGSPGARTYTAAAGQLSLAIAGSGAYICGGCVLSHGT